MTTLLNFVGLTLTGATLMAMLWSIVRPQNRIWPPQYYNTSTPFLVWLPTFTIFGCLIGLGILGWGEVPIPHWIRLGLGIPLIIISNLAVWYEVGKFGIDQTGGAEGTLKTDGLYRYSRNPQYIADTTMVIGWLLLSCSIIAVPTGIMAIAVLLAAPFAEEPWLEEKYGAIYLQYKISVRRFI